MGCFQSFASINDAVVNGLEHIAFCVFAAAFSHCPEF